MVSWHYKFTLVQGLIPANGRTSRSAERNKTVYSWI